MSSRSSALRRSTVASSRRLAGVMSGKPRVAASSPTGVGRSSARRPDGREGAETTATRDVRLGSVTRSRIGSAKEPLPKNAVRGLDTQRSSGQDGHLRALGGDLFLEAVDGDELVQRFEIV